MSGKGGTIYVLTGCTAVGKTELALDWAEANGAEIVSCDSLLFYRGMDIGTAKPTADERLRVPHHLIDIRDPHRRMDIGEYVDLAIEAVQDIRSRGRKVLVTGGSGFYLKAFFEPVVDRLAIGDETRTRVSRLEESEGLAGMLRELESLDANCRQELDADNPRRVARALERCLESGKSIRQLKMEFAAQTNELTRSDKKLVVLKRGRESLNRRIEERVRLMLDGGLVEEARHLQAAGFEANASASGSIGYRETLGHLRGEYAADELVERIATNTRRLAKKQRTWFRSQLPQGLRIDLDAAAEGLGDRLFDMPRV